LEFQGELDGAGAADWESTKRERRNPRLAESDDDDADES
jgi:hypothetical protein